MFTVNCVCRWERYQSEEEAALGRGKRLRKAVSYREAYAPHTSGAVIEVTILFYPQEHLSVAMNTSVVSIPVFLLYNCCRVAVMMRKNQNQNLRRNIHLQGEP